MIPVRQNTDWSCYLACLESFFADCGEMVTQSMIIDDFPTESHKGLENEGEFDFTPDNNAKLCAKYKIQIAHRIAAFTELQEGDFIDARRIKGQGARHIVRFLKFIDRDHIQIMDPKIGGWDIWSQIDFNAFESWVFRVSRSQPHAVIIPTS
jgi:hypothetical protein